MIHLEATHLDQFLLQEAQISVAEEAQVVVAEVLLEVEDLLAAAEVVAEEDKK
jgi:hypothetical protein